MGTWLLAFLFWQPAELVTVEGRVVNALTNQPVEKAHVVLMRTDRRHSYGMHTWNLPAGTGADDPAAGEMAVDTAADGGFRFRMESPAKFRLFTEAAGYVRSGMALEDVVEYEAKAGATDKRLSVRLMPEAGISGRVLDAETGWPVAGMLVEPYFLRAGDGSRDLAHSGEGVVTDAEGKYLVRGLKPGGHYLKLRPPRAGKLQPSKPVEDFKREVRMAYGVRWLPGVESVQQSSPVVLYEGGVSQGHDFRVKKGPVAAVRAKVSGEPGAQNIQVMVQEVSVKLDSASFGLFAGGKVDVGQEFELDRMPRGDYVLMATEMVGEERRSAGVLKFRVEEENIEGLEVALYRPVKVTGKVRLKGREPKQGEDALPMDSAVVGLMELGRTGSGARDAKVRAADGAFALEAALYDRYRCYVGKLPGGIKVSEVKLNGTVAPHGLVTLDPMSPKQELEIELAPAQGSAAIKVVDGLRAAVGATVVLVREPAAPEILIRTMSRAKTDEEGRATISGLLEGTYRLLAYRKGTYWMEDERILERIRGGVEVKIGEGAGAAVVAEVSAVSP